MHRKSSQKVYGEEMVIESDTKDNMKRRYDDREKSNRRSRVEL